MAILLVFERVDKVDNGVIGYFCIDLGKQCVKIQAGWTNHTYAH